MGSVPHFGGGSLYRTGYNSFILNINAGMNHFIQNTFLNII